MAKTSYINLLPGSEIGYNKAVQPADRFVVPRVRMKVNLLSRRRKKGVSARSLLPQIAELWNELTEEQKGSWSDAGSLNNLNGYRLFVQDTTLRLINNLPGVATPSLFHQSLVGNLHLEGSAKEIEIRQIHPANYYIYSKVVGTKSQFAPVKVNEQIGLPFTLSVNYSADLASAGSNPYALLVARFWYSYQGRDLYHDLEIPLDFQTEWKTQTATLTFLETIVIRYDLILKLYDLQGDLYFDNIKATHNGQNWARDPFCKDIDQSFTRAFYQIPKHWAPSILPFGAWFGSVYLDFDN